jgi:deoxyribodipyrimidine photo-lyase
VSKSKRILVWFKSDLRLADNETWFRAYQDGDVVIPVFVFDLRQYKSHQLGFPKSGSFRTQFLIESVAALKKNLMAQGSDLVVKIGKPEIVIDELVQQHGVTSVYTAQEVTDEEVTVVGAVEKTLIKRNIALKQFWTSTLIHCEDIPWPMHRLPDMFTQFRKEVEAESAVRAVFPQPIVKDSLSMDTGSIPTLKDLGLPSLIKDDRSVIDYQGGEQEAWRRVTEYMWKKDLLRHYKETRNGLIGSDYSSKLSLALAHGCISPKSIAQEVKRYEAERIKNDSTYWLIFELLWRDYFRFAAKKYDHSIFLERGIRNKPTHWKNDMKAFEQWRLGNTGVPFVDANMKELLLTGFMSNRGRQNVASYLTKDLGINWTWGAAWFESQLIDYDPCSNWLNWAYVAGVGNDPREDRYFNIESQVRKYDPQGIYSSLWMDQ